MLPNYAPWGGLEPYLRKVPLTDFLFGEKG